MGRKQKEKVGVYDRLGEEVNLDKCPDCLEHTDCFSCLEGKCTALNVSGGQGCPFYKPAEKGIEDCRSAYHRLKKARRYDLIEKYIKAYVAMGFLDDEIEQIEQTEATGSDELTGPDEADEPIGLDGETAQIEPDKADGEVEPIGPDGETEQFELTGLDEPTGPDETDDFKELTAQVPDHN